jgi:hypothetical protein
VASRSPSAFMSNDLVTNGKKGVSQRMIHRYPVRRSAGEDPVVLLVVSAHIPSLAGVARSPRLFQHPVRA